MGGRSRDPPTRSRHASPAILGVECVSPRVESRPVARGYLRYDASGAPRLPVVRALGSIDLNAATGSLPNLLIEYTSHNLSDADFTLTGPAITEAQELLLRLAPHFGYDPAAAARYNTKYRYPALTFLTGERLLVLYSNGGLSAVETEITKLRKLGVL